MKQLYTKKDIQWEGRAFAILELDRLRATFESYEAQVAALVHLSEKQSEKLAEALKAKNDAVEQLDIEIYCAKIASLKAELAALQPKKPKYRVGQVLRLVKNGYGDPMTSLVYHKVTKVHFSDGAYHYSWDGYQGFAHRYPESHWLPLTEDEL